MSKLPAIQGVNITDISESDMERIKKFVEDGMPGLANVTDAQLFRMYELYLTGSSYSQISNMLSLRKVVVQYLSHNSDWYNSKKEHLAELQEHIKNKVVESKIKNSEFMLLLVQAYRKRIGSKLTAFLSSNIETHMDDIDLKELAQLIKAIEVVDELNVNRTPGTKAPAININIGDGATIEKSGDNKVSITSTQSQNSVGDMLKKYADQKREEERQLISGKKHDINDNKE